MAEREWRMAAMVALSLFAAGSCASPTPIAPTSENPPVITLVVVVMPETPPVPTLDAPTPTRPNAPSATPSRASTPRATATPTAAPLAPLARDARLDALGIRLAPANVKAGQPFWRFRE